MKQKLTRASFVRIIQGNKVLLIQESGRLSRGRWSFPGGHVELGETFAQGAVREALEESGYHVKLGKTIYHKIIPKMEYLGNSKDTDEIELTVYEGFIIGGTMQIDNEALDLKWFNKEDITTLPLRWKFTQDLI